MPISASNRPTPRPAPRPHEASHAPLPEEPPRRAKPQTFWSSGEIKRLAALWLEGFTYAQLATELGRSVGSVKHVIAADRATFPYRQRPHGSTGPFAARREIKMRLSPFLHSQLRKVAKERRVSLNVVLQEALQDHVLRKLKPGQAPETRKPLRLPSDALDIEPLEEPETTQSAYMTDPFRQVLTPRQCELLAILSAHVGRPISVERIAFLMFAHEPNGGPQDAYSLIAVTAAHIRTRLGLPKGQLYSRMRHYTLTKLPEPPKGPQCP